MDVPWLETRPDGVRIRIHAQPGARRTEVAGVHGAALKLKVQAPPVEGKANEAIVAFLAQSLGCRKSQVVFVTGETSREKLIEIRGVNPEQVRELGSKR